MKKDVIFQLQVLKQKIASKEFLGFVIGNTKRNVDCPYCLCPAGGVQPLLEIKEMIN